MRYVRRVVLITVFLSLVAVVVLPASADAYTVDTTKDTPDAVLDGACADASGKCSLRAAIQEANNDVDSDTITLPAGTFKLTLAGAGEDASATGDLDILQPVQILGAGMGVTIVDGKKLDRVFDVHNTQAELIGMTVMRGKLDAEGGCLSVGGADGVLELSEMLVTGCKGSAGGGLRAVDGAEVSIEDSTFSANNAVAGGAVYTYNMESLAVLDSTFTENTATFFGGAIRTDNGGNLAVNGSTFTKNRTTATSLDESSVDGGAILAEDVVVGIHESTFIQNSTAFYGGAVEVASSMGMISGSVFQGNTAGDTGGGLYVYNAAGTFTIQESSFVGNSVTGGRNAGGGIIVDASDVAIVDSTISGNKAEFGGGIYLYEFWTRVPPQLSMEHVTVTDNKATGEGGGLYIDTGSADMDSTILAGNTAPTGPDCIATALAAVDSVIGSDSGCTIVGAGNDLNVPAGLGVLTYLEPGLTPVHVPQSGSTALGHVPDCGGSDQRGVSRPPFDCDAGAVQVDRHDLVKNGNFENGLTSWTLSTATGSKLSKAAAYTGLKGLLFKGGPTNSVLRQKIGGASLPALAQDDLLEFGGHVAINDGIQAHTTGTLTVFFSDGDKDKFSDVLDENDGDYATPQSFGIGAIDLLGDTRTVTKLKVELKSKLASKKIFVDYISLIWTPAGTRSAVRAPLPPPAAPSGFRGGN